MKKKIPLELLKVLQPTEDENLSLVRAGSDSGSILILIDKDVDSDFYYKVKHQEINGNNGTIFYNVEFKPQSQTTTKLKTKTMPLTEIKNSISVWLSYIKEYNSLNTILDNPILKAYQESFEKKYQILDDDAEFMPFDLERQLFLDEYLNTIKPKLQSLKIGRNENEIKEIEELELEVIEIQKNISKDTKSKLIKKLSRFWAKCQIVGIDVLKEVFVSIASDLAKRLLIGS